jgi:hypothetical protein
MLKKHAQMNNGLVLGPVKMLELACGIADVLSVLHDSQIRQYNGIITFPSPPSPSLPYLPSLLFSTPGMLPSKCQSASV